MNQEQIELMRAAQAVLSGHNSDLHRPTLFRATVAWCCREIRKLPRPDAIVARGMSGALVAAPVACRLGIPVAFVRKGEATHSNHLYEGPYNIDSYVIIDDFVSSGATLGEIAAGIAYEATGRRECIAVLLYNSRGSGRLIPREVFPHAVLRRRSL